MPQLGPFVYLHGPDRRHARKSERSDSPQNLVGMLIQKPFIAGRRLASVDVEHKQTFGLKRSSQLGDRLTDIRHVRHRIESRDKLVASLLEGIPVQIDEFFGNIGSREPPAREVEQRSGNVRQRDLPTTSIEQKACRADTRAKVQVMPGL